MNRIALLGLGVMGGSLARGLARIEGGPHVTGWSFDPDEGRSAKDIGAIDAWTPELEGAVEEADLVVVATPLEAARNLMAGLAQVLDPGATLTDVVSLKVPILRAVQAVGLTPRWVGCHPMCGSEQSGFGASRGDLYQGAHVWMVAESWTEPHASRVEALWRSVGGEPSRIGAAEHDRLVALASHLPQLTSNALARVLDTAGIEVDHLGPGGRDMTRLAGSSPLVWRDLLAHAPAELPLALESLASRIHTLASLLSAGDVDRVVAWMDDDRRWRSGA